MNTFILEGRLGKDAEVRETSKGGKFLSLAVAENQFSNGEQKTLWYDVICFNYQDQLVQYYKKGSTLWITGILTTELEVGKDNVPRIRRRLHASSINFPEGNNKTKSENTNNSTENTNNTQVIQPVVTTASVSGSDDSDLPF